MYKVLLLILCFFTFSCSSKVVSMNSNQNCEPKWWKNERNFFWQKKYLSGKDAIYGRGSQRGFDRSTIRTAAESDARSRILNELNLRFDNDFAATYNEVQKKIGDSEGINISKEFKNNIKTSLIANCRMCFTIKYEDCLEDGLWTGYALVELNYDNWKDKELKSLLESSLIDNKESNNEKQSESDIKF